MISGGSCAQEAFDIIRKLNLTRIEFVFTDRSKLEALAGQM
jgi:hypothetical protein